MVDSSPRSSGPAARWPPSTTDRSSTLIATARDRPGRRHRAPARPITGVSEFAFSARSRSCASPAGAGRAAADRWPLRYAQDFEALRDRTDAAAARPRVFLAALGPVAAHGARVGFATNLFQAGGIEPVVGTGTPDEIVARFAASGTDVVCLCASDQVYADAAHGSPRRCAGAGAEQVWLAGRPGDREEAERASGIDGYLFAGCDALAVLSTALDALGAA